MKKEKILMVILSVFMILYFSVNSIAKDRKIYDSENILHCTNASNYFCLKHPIKVPITIKGQVVDQNGEPLIGVNILVKGTDRGVATDLEGRFQLIDIDERAVLIISYLGYQTKEVDVNGRGDLTITLLEDSQTLDEVVVVGYGTQKKVNMTGSVATVSTEQIERRPVTSVSETLQGVVPNLNISTSGMSAEPGGELNIDIRGLGSLTGNTAPFVLVDGVPMDINAINPSDIESISVLKDAAASAIYGARAPYGVILIKTKQGSNNERVSVSYSNNISFSSPIGLPHMANSLEYMSAHDQASINAGLGANFTEENYSRVRDYMEGNISEETWLMEDGSDWRGNGIWSIAGNGNNDWLHIYYDDRVMRQKHDLSVSGGGENNSYFISAGVWDQPGELRYGDNHYNRYNVTMNVGSNPADWVSVTLNAKLINEQFQYFNTQQGWDRTTMYHNFYRNNSFRPLILPNGEFSNISYIPMLNGGKENISENTYNLSLGIEFEPVTNWKTRFRYNYRNNSLRRDDNEETVTGSFPSGEEYIIAYPIDAFESEFSNENYQLFNVISSYNLNIDNKHNFGILGGFETELNQFDRLWGKRNEIVTSNVTSLSTATGEFFLDDSKSHWSTMGTFGRFTYNLKEIYLFEVNARYDGSSRFAQDRRWGFFPSASAGYNISNENFWRDIEPVVNILKFRLSYGSLGNQNVDNYLYLNTLGISQNLGWIMGDNRPNYTLAPGLVREDLTWETSTTLNFGIDATFLRGRLSATFDIYSRETTNMFGPAEALPRVLGTSVPLSNNATLETNGFEIQLKWQDQFDNGLRYDVTANLADNVSTVTQYNNPTKTLSTWFEGRVVGDIYGLVSDGIYQTQSEVEAGPDQSIFFPRWGPGDIRYSDLDGDNKITRGEGTANSPGDFKVIGNNLSRFLLGVSGGVTWKGFDIRMFWQGVLKRDFAFEPTDMSYFGFNGHQWWNMNVWTQTTDYWRPSDETNILGPNTDGFYPRPYLSQEDYKNKEIQTRFMENASYVRLKNLTIGYSFTEEMLTKLRMDNVRLFLSGENLLTLTPLTKLLDPEALNSVGWGVGKVHPQRRVFAIGINVGL